MDFWLPEFAPSPPPPEEPRLQCHVKRGQWQKKTMEVVMENEKGGTPQLHTGIPVVRDIVKPRCHCPICCLMENATVHISKEALAFLRNLELVEHSPWRFTYYDRTRPWIRHYVNNCTNPHPLDRRMLPVTTGCCETANRVYNHRMMHPGRILKNPHIIH